jgi:uncharacterized membrane protein YphA (DoxX/SURF4 family)
MLVSTALLGARLVLACIFTVSGAGKGFDIEGSRQALMDFGLPWHLSRFAWLLPVTELAVALALLSASSVWYAAIGALALLILFIAATAVNLARGRTPDCHCFGQFHSEPIGWSTLARNTVLTAIAGFVVLEAPSNPGPSAIGWVSNLTLTQQILLRAPSSAWLCWHSRPGCCSSCCDNRGDC